MFFISSICNNDNYSTIGVLDTVDMKEEFYPYQMLVDLINKYGIKVYGIKMCSTIKINFNLKFLSTVKKYEGKTNYGDVKYLTYNERIIMALTELQDILKDCNRSSDLRDYVIRNCDYEYDDCHKKYEGMLILSAYKNGNFSWDIRED